MFAEMRKQMEPIMKKAQDDTDRMYLSILDSKQRKRLEEISLQAEGPTAVIRTEVANKLKMFPAQIEQIKGIIEQGKGSQEKLRQTAMQDGFRSFGNFRDMSDTDRQKAREEMQKKMEKMKTDGDQLKSSTEQLIAKVLNARQKASFNKMLGEPFDLSKLEMNIGMFGGRGGQGGPGGQGGQTRGGRGGDAQTKAGQDDDGDTPARPGASTGAIGSGAPTAKSKTEAETKETPQAKSKSRSSRYQSGGGGTTSDPR